MTFSDERACGSSDCNANAPFDVECNEIITKNAKKMNSTKSFVAQATTSTVRSDKIKESKKSSSFKKTGKNPKRFGTKNNFFDDDGD